MIIANKCNICGHIFFDNEYEESKVDSDGLISFICPSCQKWTDENVVEISDPAFEGNLA